MTLEKEVNKYLHYCEHQKKLDEKTIKAYRLDLEQFVKFIGGYRFEVSKESLNAYLVYLHRNYKTKTAKRKIASTKAFFTYLAEEEIIEINPFCKVKTRFKEEIVLPRIIPRQDIEQLLNYLYVERNSAGKTEWQRNLLLRDIAVVEMLFATGLRISELCKLESRVFDLSSGSMLIRGKGAKERYLQIGNEDVLEILRIYKGDFEKAIEKHGYFFVNRYGEPLSEQAARRVIHKHVEKIWGEKNITPHMFRHSFATYLMEEDVNIRYIQKMLGHASITTTQIYTHVVTEKEKEILRTKHPRNKMQIRY